MRNRLEKTKGRSGNRRRREMTLVDVQERRVGPEGVLLAAEAEINVSQAGRQGTDGFSGYRREFCYAARGAVPPAIPGRDSR